MPAAPDSGRAATRLRLAPFESFSAVTPVGEANAAPTGIPAARETLGSTPFLPEVRVPVLYTVGEFNGANPEQVKRLADATPDARMVVNPGAAHITTWDNPEANLDAVRTFLRNADNPR